MRARLVLLGAGALSAAAAGGVSPFVLPVELAAFALPFCLGMAGMLVHEFGIVSRAAMLDELFPDQSP